MSERDPINVSGTPEQIAFDAQVAAATKAALDHIAEEKAKAEAKKDKK